MGVVVQFPGRAAGRFTPEMRDTIAGFASQVPGAYPVVFGTDGDGDEFCCLGNGLMIGWDRKRHLVVTDTSSGFVDRGPFTSIHEVCLLIACIAA